MKRILSLFFSISLLLSSIFIAAPMCAKAKPGDYRPDIEILFYPVYTNDYLDYSPVSGAAGKKVSYHVTDGPEDAALDYLPQKGTLKYTASKFSAVLKENGRDVKKVFPKGDVTLGVGDYFAATVVCKNIDKLFAVQCVIRYSSNITPAGIRITSVGTGRKKVETASLVTDKSANAFYGYYDMVSGAGYYGLDTEMNEIDKRGNMFLGCAGDAPSTNVAAIDGKTAKYCTNPKTGALGYNFPHTAILGTFIFKITGKGPITFAPADPNNTVYGGYGGGLYTADAHEISIRELTTYAPQNGCPGSRKMTFFSEWGGNGAGSSAAVDTPAAASLKAPVIRKLKPKRKAVKVSWTKQENATAYQLQYSTNKDFKNAKTKKLSADKTSLTIRKLKKGKSYYFRIRSVKGKSVSPWSSVKNTKTK